MIEQAVLIAQLTIVAVLVVSGLAKRREVQSTRSVLRLLKLPRWLQVPWVASALPWGELALAAALLVPVRPVAVLASVGVLVLFIAYWVVIARALRFNPRPACGCFGRIGDQSVTERTLVRNTLLVMLAVLGLVGSIRGAHGARTGRDRRLAHCAHLGSEPGVRGADHRCAAAWPHHSAPGAGQTQSGSERRPTVLR